MPAAEPEHRDDAEVHQEEGHGVKKSSDAAGGEHAALEVGTFVLKGRRLLLLPRECTDHTDADQILAGVTGDAVELLLITAIHRNRFPCDRPEDEAEERRHREEQQRELPVDDERHHDRAHH